MEPMLLLGLDVPVEGLVTAGVGASGLAATALKLLWSHWDKKHDAEVTANKSLVESKDSLLRSQAGEFRTILDRKDVYIDILSKALSGKSDELAAKIEKLMGETIVKIETWHEKSSNDHKHTLTVVSEFTTEVTSLANDVRELSGRPPSHGSSR